MTGGGLQSEPAPLMVYTSRHSHSSVEKAALLTGFGRDNVRLVPFDDTYAMRADALASIIDEDLAGRPAALRRRRHRRDDGDDRGRSDRRHRRDRRDATRSGCTWTRRWPARR